MTYNCKVSCLIITTKIGLNHFYFLFWKWLGLFMGWNSICSKSKARNCKDIGSLQVRYPLSLSLYLSPTPHQSGRWPFPCPHWWPYPLHLTLLISSAQPLNFSSQSQKKSNVVAVVLTKKNHQPHKPKASIPRGVCQCTSQSPIKF